VWKFLGDEIKEQNCQKPGGQKEKSRMQIALHGKTNKDPKRQRRQTGTPHEKEAARERMGTLNFDDPGAGAADINGQNTKKGIGNKSSKARKKNDA